MSAPRNSHLNDECTDRSFLSSLLQWLHILTFKGFYELYMQQPKCFEGSKRQYPCRCATMNFSALQEIEW
jgi:hypothetical protein